MESSPYIEVGLFLLVGISFPIVTMLAGKFLRPSKFDPVKLSPYECGVEPFGDAKMRISSHFYLIAVVFLVFDVETVFLLPWAVIYGDLKLFGFIEMMIFLLLLVAAYAYAWMKGALEWER